MNQSPPLDTFESGLLAELRRHVTEHPAPVPARTPPRRSRTPLRLAAVAAAGVAASVVAVFGLGPGGSGGSPAYAVETDSHGDVIVTVHRLDDASGLEKALKAQGIDADVSYDADGFNGPPPPGDPGPVTGPGGPGGPQTHIETQNETGPGHTEAGPGAAQGDDPCDLGGDPATLTQQGTDWVLRIPASSPLQDRHVEIGTSANGALSVQYAGDQPNSMCGMVTLNRGAAPRTE